MHGHHFSCRGKVVEPQGLDRVPRSFCNKSILRSLRVWCSGIIVEVEVASSSAIGGTFGREEKPEMSHPEAATTAPPADTQEPASAAARDIKRPNVPDSEGSFSGEQDSSAGNVASPVKRVRRTCPYLGTINKHMLDFDFEKVCSICLSNQHVYACLVCGRYFQGDKSLPL